MGWLDGLLAAVVWSRVRDRRHEMKIKRSRKEIEKVRRIVKSYGLERKE